MDGYFPSELHERYPDGVPFSVSFLMEPSCYLLLGCREANLCFTLQEVEKICRTLQSHVMQVWTMTFWLLAPDPDKAEPLPVLSNKLPFFSTDALAQIA